MPGNTKDHLILACVVVQNMKGLRCWQALPWFSGMLAYPYEPHQHGAVSEWMIQLVTTSFTDGQEDMRTMHTIEDVHRAADAWQAAQQVWLPKFILLMRPRLSLWVICMAYALALGGFWLEHECLQGSLQVFE